MVPEVGAALLEVPNLNMPPVPVVPAPIEVVLVAEGFEAAPN